MLRNTVGGRGCSFPGKKRYEGVRFNFDSVTREWVKFPGKKRYVTLEWPLCDGRCIFGNVKACTPA